mmetsp:Transcript_9173/g.22570  ORF Transcript_9173/g.22570 Transcript_9173/m.22570 type:complete len:238 (+) Transcript_9173:213-926(+)
MENGVTACFEREASNAAARRVRAAPVAEARADCHVFCMARCASRMCAAIASSPKLSNSPSVPRTTQSPGTTSTSTLSLIEVWSVFSWWPSWYGCPSACSIGGLRYTISQRVGNFIRGLLARLCSPTELLIGYLSGTSDRSPIDRASEDMIRITMNPESPRFAARRVEVSRSRVTTHTVQLPFTSSCFFTLAHALSSSSIGSTLLTAPPRSCGEEASAVSPRTESSAASFTLVKSWRE